MPIPERAIHDPRYGGALYRILALTLTALVIGALVSLAAIAFVESIAWLNDAVLISHHARAQVENAWLLIPATVLVPALGGLLVGLLLQHGSRVGRPTGPPDVIHAVQLHSTMPSTRDGMVSTLAVVLSIGCGASVGQYGPLVYLGAMIGNWANALKLRIPNISAIAIACGVAAAISTAFNAPIAGMVFAHELILRHYSLQAFAPTTVASVVGYVVANIVFERDPLFLVEFAGVSNSHEFVLFAILGVVTAALAVGFMRLILAAQARVKTLSLAPYLRTAAAGALVGCTALMLPDVLGVGREALRFATIEGAFHPAELPLLVIAKLVLTALCIAAGFAGGVFSPAMLIGILFGAFFWQSIDALGISNAGVVPYAISGMVAMASPVIGAPLTMILIVFELTRNYDLTIAAMVAVVFSNLFAFRWFGRSLFDVQLTARGVHLDDGRDRAILEHHHLGEHVTDDYLSLPVDTPRREALAIMDQQRRNEAVVVDATGRYQGLLRQSRLRESLARQPASVDEHRAVEHAHNPASASDSSPSVANISIEKLLDEDVPVFDQHTSLWQAMQGLESFVGDAVPLIDADTRKVLGVITERRIIEAYLQTMHGLRREEHHAL
ncbi:MAG: chloride ion channel [Gammaproteobacteria bacterium]|nr:MAG: chloride ion channel [Gammaproteobacteria bacterium]